MDEQKYERCRKCGRRREVGYLEAAGGVYDPHFKCLARMSCKRAAKAAKA